MNFFYHDESDIGSFADIPQDCINHISSYLTIRQSNRLRVNHDMNNLVNNFPEVKHDHQLIKEVEAFNQYNKDMLPAFFSSAVYIVLAASIYGESKIDITFKDVLTIDKKRINENIFDMSMGALIAGCGEYFVSPITFKDCIPEMILGAATTIGGIYGIRLGYCLVDTFLKQTSLPKDLKYIGSYAGLMIGEYVAAKSTRAVWYAMQGGDLFYLFKKEKEKVNAVVEKLGCFFK